MISNEYLPLILIAGLVVLIVLFLLFRPKQRVRLTDGDRPIRPHMTGAKDSPKEANDISAEAAAAASDVTGEIIKAPVHEHLSNGPGSADDLQRIKGIGPKLADMLSERGYTSFGQLARLTPEETAMLDDQLGAFRGRIQRDRVVEQAQFLERGDSDGFEREFGKL